MNIAITCSGCGNEFIFTEKDQSFYIQEGYNPPKRCKSCRKSSETITSTNLNYKTSSYFKNAQVFGAGIDVHQEK